MLNLPVTHPGAGDLSRRNGFSVSRSSNLSSRNPVDTTIEQTINRHAKSHGGIIGFSRNYAAYHRWCTTRHSRAKYDEATFDVADMSSNESSTHKELRPSQMKTSESNVKKVVDAISGFTNPFERIKMSCTAYHMVFQLTQMCQIIFFRQLTLERKQWSNLSKKGSWIEQRNSTILSRG